MSDTGLIKVIIPWLRNFYIILKMSIECSVPFRVS